MKKVFKVARLINLVITENHLAIEFISGIEHESKYNALHEIEDYFEKTINDDSSLIVVPVYLKDYYKN